ncbi:MAG: methylmalonyl Co-A mutase-associated GTPase MeaB [Bacteroidia bacterium]|nr:methylmalonyl Co-A mutase-associated GTPase MeaB [Bacteroidia bacterium]NNF30289.1 methylmalonyl Co-A mutase-associated GTPase MeaB [Flavobacteriaceae bacterium]NNM08650.1 methylmalonyl Co-A mutase-associated GTPase MeaB [Flavobacteriaceae bacterium]
MSKSVKKSDALHEVKGVPQPSSVSLTAADKVKKSRKKRISPKKLLDGMLSGDKSALSRAITLIESTKPKHRIEARELLEACLPYANNSLRIGITGVPGVGKSTFIERFGKLYTSKGHNVAVLAVDPSSKLSKGSILGDKTRMEELVKDKNAFIRPSASGSSLGGVARKTREAIILCEAAGFDIIIIETVGVGQSETMVHSMTDFFLLLKLAGAGDELQGIKRGIMEMADAIVINKADGENIKAAKLAKAEFNRALHLFPEKESGWSPKTLTCSAIKNEGIAEIADLISDYVKITRENSFFLQRRNDQNKYWLLQTIESSLKNNFYENPEIKKALREQLKALDENKTTPFEAANYLLSLNQR